MNMENIIYIIKEQLLRVKNNNKVNICTSHNQFYDLGYISSQDFPSGTKYIRVCFPKSYVNFGIGSHDSCLYDYYIKKELVTKKDIESIESNFNKISKKCLFYGDSITAQDLFQKIIKEKLGIDYVNCGNPGYPISNVFANNNDHGFALSNTYKMNELINLINTNQTQYLFVMGGTNDFGYDGTKVSEEGSLHAVVIGDLSYPYNRNTYKGALSNIIDRVQRECVTIEKIFIMSPIQIGEEGATDIVKNAIGISMYDFRNACEDVANKFSCEFIDVYNSGINFINWSKYIPDKIHPNELGARLIANKIISYLKNIEHIY